MSAYRNGKLLTEVKAGETGYGFLIENDGHIIGNKDVIQQIKEDINNQHKFVIPDDFVVSAVFQKYGVKNANRRIYPENILKREVEKYLNGPIKMKTSIGALDHPSSTALSGHDVSHKILDLRWEGQTLVGEMKLHLSQGFKRYGICSTSGDLAANMILDDILIGVSSRGVGGVVEKFGNLYVDDTFELICWDIVCEPSTNGAYIKQNPSDLRPFMESYETNKDKGLISEKILKIKSILS